MYVIYKIENVINNKVYIGKTSIGIERRWKRHLYYAKKGINRYLYDAIRCYGENSFIINQIESCDDSQVNIRERFWISECKSTQKQYGYNMTEGGDGGNIGTEGYEKIAAQRRGIKLTQSHKDNISLSLKGKCPHPMTAEMKHKISYRLKEIGHKPPIPNYHGKTHPMYNKHHTQASKQKISAVRMGKTYDELFDIDTSYRLRERHRYKWMGVNNPNYVNFDVKKNINDILHAPNLVDYAKLNGVSYPTILSKFKKEYGLTINEYRHENNITY